MDPLSDVLSMQKHRVIDQAASRWVQMAVQWPKHPGIKCYTMLSGQCWLSVEVVPDAVLLTARTVSYQL